MDSSAVPKVSVIIPLYNKAPYIKRALDSVFAQTVQDFEVIVVNDGSKDGGEKIVEEYGDSRIHLINQENQGVSAARNHGVDAARAELVAFLDADDEWLPEFLEKTLCMKERYANAVLYGTEVYYVDDNEGGQIVTIDEEVQLVSSTYLYDHFVLNKLNFVMSSVLIPKEIFYKVGKFDTTQIRSEDNELFARLSISGDVVCTNLKLAKIYRDTLNNTQDKKPRKATKLILSDYLSGNNIHMDDMCIKGCNDVNYFIIYMNIIYGYRDCAKKQLKIIRPINLKQHLKTLVCCILVYSPEVFIKMVHQHIYQKKR